MSFSAASRMAGLSFEVAVQCECKKHDVTRRRHQLLLPSVSEDEGIVVTAWFGMDIVEDKILLPFMHFVTRTPTRISAERAFWPIH
jgi:hypothetical protein